MSIKARVSCEIGSLSLSSILHQSLIVCGKSVRIVEGAAELDHTVQAAIPDLQRPMAVNGDLIRRNLDRHTTPTRKP